MAENNTGAGKYAGNSNRDQVAADEAAPKVEKVVSGVAVQRKKPLSRRIAENLGGSDARSVGHYVLFEVIFPQLKDLIFDVGSSALQRALFGESGGKSYSTGRRTAGYTPYSSMASATPKQQSVVRQQTIPSDEFGEIVVETRGEAQAVMDKMNNLIERFGMASVSDLKAAVGLTGKFTDEQFGWQAMGGTDIRRVGGAQPGFVLIFPMPEQLP